jgi:hypothetical protein
MPLQTTMDILANQQIMYRQLKQTGSELQRWPEEQAQMIVRLLCPTRLRTS